MKIKEQRFWEKVDKKGPDDCWPWVGCLSSDKGYPKFKDQGRYTLAYRIIWELVKGPIPYGMRILHSCGNRVCCNIKHLSLRPRTRTLEDRFWEKVDRKSKEECWLWLASCVKDGYGNIYVGSVRGKNIYKLAHRVSWRLAFGEIPEGLSVLHKCDVPGCCNPNHLFLGDQFDNMRDMATKRRTAGTKLSESQVREIRKRYREGGITHDRLGTLFNMSKEAIRHVIIGKTWKHVL